MRPHDGSFSELSPSDVLQSHPIYLSKPEDPTTFWPLLQRAWGFQERMLSPRVLHFAREELIWECQEATWGEWSKMRPYGKDKKFHETIRITEYTQKTLFLGGRVSKNVAE